MILFAEFVKVNVTRTMPYG